MEVKNKVYYVFVFIALIGVTACSSSKNSSATNDESYGGTTEVNVDNSSISLADYLRRVSGVQVSGNGSSATITVRGTGTMIGDSSPLFVLDAVKSGRDFGRISRLVNMSEVIKIRVLKGIEASAGYGQQGGNGVIEIYTDNG